MSTLEITVDGTTQVLQLGTLSAAVNQQITQAVSASAASAQVAAASETAAIESASAASISAEGASDSSTSAGVSAGEASASAQSAATSAASIQTSTSSTPNKIPLANNSGVIDPAWLGSPTLTTQWLFTIFPQAHSSTGNATPIYGRTSTDGITVGAWNLLHDGIAGDLLHMTTGPNSVSNANGAIIALGVDYGGTGLITRNKSTGIALHVDHLNTVSSTSSFGCFMYHDSSVGGPFSAWQMDQHAATPMIKMYPVAGVTITAGAKWFDLYCNAVGGNTNAGSVYADTGLFDWRRTIQTIAPNSSVTPLLRVADEVANNPSEVYLGAKTNGELGIRAYRWAGSSNLMYAHAWLASSDRFKLQVGNGAQAKGAETLATLIEVRANATPQMGFFGATPVAQQIATQDLKTVLVNIGLLAAAGSATPLNLEGGRITAGFGTFSGAIDLSNTIQLRGIDSGAVARNLVQITSGNQINVGDDAVSTYLRGSNVGFAPGGVPKLTANSGGVGIVDAVNITLGTTTGSKLGANSTQKLGFWGATPVVQPSGTPVAATDAATTQALVNSLRASLVSMGIVA